VAFPNKLLNEGETKVLDLRPHWLFLLKQILALAGAVIVGILVLVWDLPGPVKILAAILVIAALLWFAAQYAKWSTTNFVITTDRLIYRYGVYAKHGIEIPLDRVNTVFYSQSIFERMCGTGDVRIESAGEQGTQNFSNIRKPSAVQSEIYKQMEEDENRKHDRIGRAAQAAPVAAADSVPQQIAQLDELRQRGVLSEQEFQDKKAELLKRM
jgi:uncharacterized membrane protein YdbT with pleckstrin-like domain